MGHSCARASSAVLVALLCSLTFSASAWAQTPAPAQAPAASAEPAPPPPPPAPSASAGAEAAARAADGETAEWAQRDQDINESNTLTGGSGLLRTQHAQTGSPGQFRLAFVSEWFSAGFLCTERYPCPNPNGGVGITSDTLSHTGGTLSLGMSLFNIGSGTFDGYLSTSAIANSDSVNRPSLLQVLGDTNLGIKYVAPVGDVIHLGLFSELWLINGTGSVGLSGDGTSAKFGGVATADLRGTPSSQSHVPLRFSANVVYSLDNTAAVLTATENARQEHVTRVERFGLGVNRVDHFDFLLGGEAFLADDRVRPFIEARLLAAINRQGYQCQPLNPSSDGCLKTDTVVPATMTIGSRFFPWKRGFSVIAALDIGLGGTGNFIEELQPTPPWTLYLGAGWAVDTQDRPPVVKTVEHVVQAAAPRARVVGFVHEKDKNDPVVNAIATYRDHADLSPLATATDGKFSDEVPPGTYTYDIKAEGYKPGSCDANVPSENVARDTTAGKTVDIDCPLEALPRLGTVVGHVHDAETNQPMSGVQVVLTDSAHKDSTVNSDSGGAFRVEGVAPGTAEIRVETAGYLVLVVPADVKPRQESTVDLMLRPQPKHAKVALTAKEITIREQIQFALDSAVILPESFGILTEIADTMIRHPEVKRIEVQGHTDNTGTAEHNQGLSDQRAEAVRAWLVQHGVAGDRLVAKGYGQDRPLVPNVTPANRGQNRRVQFIILEK